MERRTELSKYIGLATLVVSTLACQTPNVNVNAYLAPGGKTQKDLMIWAEHNGRGISVQAGVDLNAAELFVFPYINNYPNSTQNGNYIIHIQTP